MSARAWLGCVAAIAAGTIAALHAQSQYAPTLERPVVTVAAGAQRLAVDVPLVAGAAPFETIRNVGTANAPRWRAYGALSDLRLFIGEGGDAREIGYLLAYPDPAGPEWVAGALLPIAPTETATTKTSGFEVDLGAAETVDMIRVDGLPAPFLKRVVIEGSGDREHWTLLAAEGTLFDLPSERLRQMALPFRAGAYRYLRATWDDTQSGRVPLPQTVFARRAETGAPPPALTTDVQVERRPSEPGRSRYRLRLPRARLPIVALSLDVGGGHVFRQVRVSESRFSGVEAVPTEIGRGTIARVTQSGATATQLRIPVTPPREPELELVVDDGNNPPLDVRRVVAEFAEMPWIYFEAPDGPVVARYGDVRASAPSYDLEAARASIRLADVPVAAWGEARATMPSAAAPPPTPLPDTGAEIGPAAFRVQRPLPDGPAGLVALAVDPAMLAQSSGPASRFADVRIVDAANRQVPYLVERREEPLTIQLQMTPFTPKARELQPTDGRQRSMYALRLPYGDLPSVRLVFETSARVFQRAVQVGVERPPDRQHRDAWFDVKASSAWLHADDTTAAPPVTLAVDVRDTELVVAVDEGDNQALPITAVRALLPSYRLRFYRPAGPLRVLYGRDDLSPPQYDLALLAPQVMGAEAREISAAPADAPPERPWEQLLSPRMFWIGLSAAVLALLAIIARLVKP